MGGFGSGRGPGPTGARGNPAEETARQERRAAFSARCADLLMEGRPETEIRVTLVRENVDLPRSTIYRWVQGAIESGFAAKRLSAKRLAGPGLPVVQESGGPAGVAGFPLASAMAEALSSTRGVLRYARGDDPEKPRNPKLTLAAAQALASQVEQSVQLHRAMLEAERVDRFHAALLDEIGRESPDLARRVTDRLQALTQRLDV